LLFSEIAHVDFGTLLCTESAKLPDYLAQAGHRLRTDVPTFMKVCSQLFVALKAMQEHAGMVHEDLHWRNVLISVDDFGELMPLIHDFGASRVRAFMPAAVDMFPRMVELSEVVHGTVLPHFSTEARVTDLNMLFVKHLLPFAKRARSGVDPRIVLFLQQVEAALVDYVRKNRRDAALFDELVELAAKK
jgi:hypothetical protein